MTLRTLFRWASIACGVLAWVGVARAETRLGVSAGPAFFTQVETPSDERFDVGTRTALAAGLVLDLDVSDRLWIRLAPIWIEKGSTFRTEFFGEAVEGVFKLGYVELPVTLNVALTSGSVRPYLTGGAAAASLARARVEVSANGMTEEEGNKEVYKDWDFGLTFGGGLEFGERVRGFVEGRYTWGLTNVAEDSEDLTLKNRGWQVLAGLTFGL